LLPSKIQELKSENPFEPRPKGFSRLQAVCARYSRIGNFFIFRDARVDQYDFPYYRQDITLFLNGSLILLWQYF